MRNHFALPSLHGVLAVSNLSIRLVDSDYEEDFSDDAPEQSLTRHRSAASVWIESAAD